MASSRLILLTIDTNPAFHQEVPRIETPRKFQSHRDSRPTNDKWKIGSTALTSHSRDCSLSRKAYLLETGWSRLSWRARRLRVRQLNTKSHSPNQLSRLSSMTRRRKRRTILLWEAQISTTRLHLIFAYNWRCGLVASYHYRWDHASSVKSIKSKTSSSIFWRFIARMRQSKTRWNWYQTTSQRPLIWDMLMMTVILMTVLMSSTSQAPTCPP